jgi:hypothetical protein
MTGFCFVINYLGLSSWKFRRDGITTLIRFSEIIRDLQRAPMLTISRAIDSRSGDCGNDGFSIARTNVGNFTRYRFPLKRLRE